MVTPTSDAEVVALDRISSTHEGLLGPKARNLARLMEGGLSVPRGFVVTVAAWRRVLDAGLGLEVAHALDGIGPGAPLERLAAAAARARALHAAVTLPRDLEESIRSAYRALGAAHVAVRSSATEEDQAHHSAAGVFATTLDVTGEDAVIRAVLECWASLYGETALAYRLARGLDPRGGSMAVVVQAMVAADTAGVLFTRSRALEKRKPADKDVILVEAVPGRGRALVDGEANPERYEIDDERTRHVFSGGVERNLLTGDELSALSRAAHQVEALLGPAVDVEWAIAEGRLQILQARPITAPLRPVGRAPVRWTAANTQEALLDPVAPLTWSLLFPLVERGRSDLFRAAGFKEIDGPGYMRLFYGRPYFNPDYFRAWLRQVPGAPENIFDALIFGEGTVDIHFRVPEFDSRTIRSIALLLASRVAARERFELFLAFFGSRVGALAARDLAAASDRALVETRAAATGLAEEAFRRHVLGTAISGASYLLLDLFLKKSGVDEALGGGVTARLTAGARGNVLAQANERLHELAAIAAQDPLVERALLEGPARTAPLAIAELARSGPARSRAVAKSFVDTWRRFLDEHGHRAEREAELAAPRWVEEPQEVVSVLRSFVASPGREPPREREERLARDARALAQTVARELRKSGGVERFLPMRTGLFWLLYREARRYAPYRENLKAAALRALLVVKRCFLEMGKRLVARGLLAEQGHVFFLEVEEVESALEKGAQAQALEDRIRTRRAEHARAVASEPPPYVLEGSDGEIRPLRAPAPEAAGVLRGVPVSQGQVTGTARVMRSLEEAPRLRPGDVIVARVVNAGWTPLFVLAGGIVAEMGGALSHGAIVAREYGIPCVFGVAGATSRVKDGDRVTVDADRGIVSIVGTS